MVLDRFYCFLDMNASTILPKGKKAAVIVTAGADETGAERVAKGLEAIMTQHFFCESVGTLPYCTWFMPVGMPVDADVMTEAREMGARMARSDPGSAPVRLDHPPADREEPHEIRREYEH